MLKILNLIVYGWIHYVGRQVQNNNNTMFEITSLLYHKFCIYSSSSPTPLNRLLALRFQGNSLATTLSNNWLSLWHTPAKLPRIRLAPKRQPLLGSFSSNLVSRSGDEGSSISIVGTALVVGVLTVVVTLVVAPAREKSHLVKKPETFKILSEQTISKY